MDWDGDARKRQHEAGADEGEKRPRFIARLFPQKIWYALLDDNRRVLTEIMHNFVKEHRLRASSFRLGVKWFPGTGDMCHGWLQTVEAAIAGLFDYVNRVRLMRNSGGSLCVIVEFLDELDLRSSEATPIQSRITLGDELSSKLVDMRDRMTQLCAQSDTGDAEINPELGAIVWTK